MVNFQFKNTFFLYYVLEHSKIVHLVRKPLFYTIYILLPTIAVTSKLFQALDGALDGATTQIEACIASQSETEAIDILGMVISVFHLPNMGGEKITLSISVLLALTFFLNLVSGLTPRNEFFLIGLSRFDLEDLFDEDSRFPCSIK